MDIFVMEASHDRGRTWFLVDTSDQSFHAIRQARERAKRLKRWERVLNTEVGAVLLTVDEEGSTIAEKPR